MNRKDMIIVAALINAGLLVILFISAAKTERIEEKGPPSSYKTPIAGSKTSAIKPAKSSQKGDQIDQVISQYSAKVAEKEKPRVLSLPILTPEPKVTAGETSKASMKQSENFRTVTVEKGDALERIARHNGVSVEEIMTLNKLSHSRLRIGQVLKLPLKPVAKKNALLKQVEGKYYTVKGGDTPWTIAQKNGMQVEELLELNNMDEEKAKRLRPGDKLRIK